jgi:MYXO-CTERM domain-containing protein
VLRWPVVCIDLYLQDPPGMPGVNDETVREALRAAMQAWTDDGSELQLRLAGGTSEDRVGLARHCPAASNAHVVLVVRENWTHEASPGNLVVALTSVTYERGSGIIRDADIELNALDFTWGDATRADAPRNMMDLQSTLTHEVGHLIGLDHTRPETFEGLPGERWDRTTMYARTLPLETHKRVLMHDDLAGLRALFGPAADDGTPRPCPDPGPPFFARSPDPPDSDCREQDRGCGCRTGRSGPPPAGLALVLAGWLGLRRRRPARGQGPRALMLAALLACALAPWGRASANPAPPDDLRMVGHRQIRQLEPTVLSDGSRGWLSLGVEGLVVAWTEDGEPWAWRHVPAARSMLVSPADVLVFTDTALERLDAGTLQPQAQSPVAGSVRCPDGTRGWWWAREEPSALRWESPRGSVALEGATHLPALEAHCIVWGDQAWAWWLEGDALHAVGQDGRHSEWPWTAPTVQVHWGGDAPWWVGLSGAGTWTGIPWRADTGTSATDFPGRVGWSPGCGLWDARGRALPCSRQTPDASARALLPPLTVWPHVASLPDGWIAWNHHAVLRVAATDDAMPPVFARWGGPSRQVLGSLLDDAASGVLACETHQPGRVDLVWLRVTPDLHEGWREPVAACPANAWADGQAMSVVVDGRWYLASPEGLRGGEPATASALSAPLGRNAVHFELHARQRQGCPWQAWSLVRDSADGGSEPWVVDVCAEEAWIAPVAPSEGGTPGVVLGVRRGNVWQLRAFSFAGEPGPDRTWTGQDPATLRWTVTADQLSPRESRAPSAGVEAAAGQAWFPLPARLPGGTDLPHGEVAPGRASNDGETWWALPLADQWVLRRGDRLWIPPAWQTRAMTRAADGSVHPHPHAGLASSRGRR